MTSIEREALLVTADTLQLVVRRMDDNAVDAIDMVIQSLSAAGESRVRPSELLRAAYEVNRALRSTPRGAPPGTFARLHVDIVEG